MTVLVEGANLRFSIEALAGLQEQTRRGRHRQSSCGRWASVTEAPAPGWVPSGPRV